MSIVIMALLAIVIGALGIIILYAVHVTTEEDNYEGEN